ncbi:MAG: FkbM family methyltransferase [Pirellulaceae bacterium]
MNLQARNEAVIARHIRGAPGVLYDLGVGPKSEWRTLKKIFPELKVFGCEPHPETHKWLLEQGFPGTLLPVAIGDEAGTVTLYDIEGDAKRASLFPLAERTREFTTDVWTLDQFDEAFGKPDRIVLWMDIEGREKHAVLGGQKLLSSGRVRWINLEERRGGDCPAVGWTDPAELLELLAQFGFVRTAAYNRYKTHQDAIYVHRREWEDG